MTNTIKLFAGTANKPLADEISKLLNIPLEDVNLTKFQDGEICVELIAPIRGHSAYIIQSGCRPTNDNLMEIILLTDALRRASVHEVILVCPYFPYSRQDRRPSQSRVPISARVVADLMQSAGIDHILTVDIHALQIEGFFKIPVDNISATNIFSSDICSHYDNEQVIIVSPDVGGVARARKVAKELNDLDLAIVDKRRPNANMSEVMNIIGDVKGKVCVILDDMVDTAGTLCKAADALIDIGGATKVVAYASHGVLSGNAASNIANSKLSELVVTDSIIATQLIPKVRYISLAKVLADTIYRISTNQSLTVY